MRDLTEDSNYLSIIQDPFSKSCITSVSTHCFRTSIKFHYQGRVEFKRGNTEGTQKFVASSFKDLSNQMDIFIKSL